MTAVWYRERYHENKRAGLCVECDIRESEPGITMCGACAERKGERNKSYYWDNLEKGMCARHKNIPHLPGIRLCQTCRERDLARKNKSRKGAS